MNVVTDCSTKVGRITTAREAVETDQTVTTATCADAVLVGNVELDDLRFTVLELHSVLHSRAVDLFHFPFRIVSILVLL